MTKRTLCLLACFAAAPAWAGGTSHWTHSNEVEFAQGRFDDVVATNLGDLKLSRAITTLLEQDPRVNAVYALAEGADGTIYAGTGPQGIVLQVKDEKVSTFLTLEDENIFSLLIDRQNRLVIGTGGERGRVLRVEKAGEKPTELFASDVVQYVWKIRQTADGNIYAATGPEGQLIEITPDGKSSVLFDSDESNLLSLISDGGDRLYVGTDPNGLVYRINRKTKDVFVVFDAPESEVGALVLDARGNLFAGTGQAVEGEENHRPSGGASEKAGRPESPEAAPAIPEPDPGQPVRPEPPEGPDEDRIPRAEVEEPDDSDEPDEPIERLAPRAMRPHHQQAGRAFMAGGEDSAEGNAIYRIDPNGFVTEVFRQPLMVLSLVEKDGLIIAGTGSGGQIYQVNPAAEETVVLAKVEPKQVTSLLSAKDGRLILGLSNVGGLASMSSGHAAQGTYTSPVLDAGQISSFGKMHLQGTLPGQTSLSVSTRSGNLQEPADQSWTKWSEPVPAAEFVQIPSPPARFLQYRLHFASETGQATPVVSLIDVAHQVPNLAPQIGSVRIVAAPQSERMVSPQQLLAMAREEGSAEAGSTRLIAWKASDPNEDELQYTLHFRNGSSGPWIQLEEKLTDRLYEWDTRTVPDGRYQIKVEASDAKANPKGHGRTASRVSDTFVVDNTPPVIGDLKVEPLPGGVSVGARVVDRTGTVQSVQYSVDSRDDWQAVAASDSIFDSPEEGVSFKVEDLPAGLHQIMLRASDDQGNEAYEIVRVTVGQAEQK